MYFDEINRLREDIKKVKTETSKKILRFREYRNKEIERKSKRIEYLKKFVQKD